jgi:hypothetical protein
MRHLRNDVIAVSYWRPATDADAASFQAACKWHTCMRKHNKLCYVNNPSLDQEKLE